MTRDIKANTKQYMIARYTNQSHCYTKTRLAKEKKDFYQNTKLAETKMIKALKQIRRHRADMHGNAMVTMY